MVYPSQQSQLLCQLETMLDGGRAGPLPVADRLDLRRLADALRHASTLTDKPLADTSRVDAAVKALTRFKANLKRHNNARDGLTSKHLMDRPGDAQAILLRSIAFIFRDEVDEWSQIDFGKETHVEMLEASVASSLTKLTNPQGRPVN